MASGFTPIQIQLWSYKAFKLLAIEVLLKCER